MYDIFIYYVLLVRPKPKSDIGLPGADCLPETRPLAFGAWVVSRRPPSLTREGGVCLPCGRERQRLAESVSCVFGFGVCVFALVVLEFFSCGLCASAPPHLSGRFVFS